VAQLSVPNKTALRKCFYGSYLRRTTLNERRGQDSNLRTSFPVTDLANRRFRPLSHLSKYIQHPPRGLVPHVSYVIAVRYLSTSYAPKITPKTLPITRFFSA
jgi:hypothetical protein